MECKVSGWGLCGMRDGVSAGMGWVTYRFEVPALENLVRGEFDAACAQEVEADVVTGSG